MKINLTVTYDDGRSEAVSCGALDLVKFEEHFNQSIQTMGSSPRFGQLCWLAWSSLHRRGRTSLDFEGWLDTVDELADSEEGDPTPPLGLSPSTG